MSALMIQKGTEPIFSRGLHLRDFIYNCFLLSFSAPSSFGESLLRIYTHERRILHYHLNNP